MESWEYEEQDYLDDRDSQQWQQELEREQYEAEETIDWHVRFHLRADNV
jgi:hypothetical protein